MYSFNYIYIIISPIPAENKKSWVSTRETRIQYIVVITDTLGLLLLFSMIFLFMKFSQNLLSKVYFSFRAWLGNCASSLGFCLSFAACFCKISFFEKNKPFVVLKIPTSLLYEFFKLTSYFFAFKLKILNKRQLNTIVISAF
jgi:hypothetical protein